MSFDFFGEGKEMKKVEWIRCPVCGNKICDRMREDTKLRNFPLYYPKCKPESLSKVNNLELTIIKEPDAK